MKGNRLQIESELLLKNINPTAMRILVLDFLKKQHEAVTLADIEAGFEHSDRITIYRTLKTFKQKGLIHSISNGVVTQYALCSKDCSGEKHKDTHVHFICNICKKTVCLTQVSIPKINMPDDFQDESTEVLVRGICKNCNR